MRQADSPKLVESLALARDAWACVDKLEARRRQLLKQEPFAHPGLAELEAQLGKQRHQALLKAQRAAQLVWGVSLGCRYQLSTKAGSIELLVDFLRPAPSRPGGEAYLCSGVADDQRLFVVLDPGVRVLRSIDSTVVSMQAWRSARTPGRGHCVT